MEKEEKGSTVMVETKTGGEEERGDLKEEGEPEEGKRVEREDVEMDIDIDINRKLEGSIQEEKVVGDEEEISFAPFGSCS